MPMKLSAMVEPNTLLLADGTSIYYELFGVPSGDRLFIISPSNTTALAVRGSLSQGPIRFDQRYRCCVFDHRGTGGSTMPDEPPEPSMRLLAADAYALLSHLGWAPCNVLGLSLGGMVAIELALAEPAAVASLLVVCAAAAVGDAPACSAPLHELLGVGAERRCRRLLELADPRRDADWFGSELGEASVQYMLDAEEELERDSKAGGRLLEGRAWQLRARATYDATARLESGGGSLPRVGILAAAHDDITPPRASASLAEAIPGSELVWFADGAHWPNLARDEPRRFDAAASAFFSSGTFGDEMLRSSEREARAIDFARPRADVRGGAGVCAWVCEGACAIL